MSWRIIKIGTGGKLSFDNNRLRFEQTETKETFFFPIEDIAVLVLESLQLSLSTALVSELSDNAVTVIFCNGKHRPVSVLSPIGKPLRQSEIAFLQTGMSEPLQKRLWQKTVPRSDLLFLFLTFFPMNAGHCNSNAHDKSKYRDEKIPYDRQ